MISFGNQAVHRVNLCEAAVLVVRLTTAGVRTFEWSYVKDWSTSVGLDTAWIDAISIPID